MGNMEEKIKQSILHTLAYFDVFDYGLTFLEIYKFIYTDNVLCAMPACQQGFTDKDILNKLVSLIQSGEVQHQEGYYFLPGREEIVAKRQANVWLVEEKMKQSLRGIKKLARVPFIRSVFVCNTVAGVGVEEKSDIDVFIIVKKGRIFLARAIATFILSLFNLRRTKRKIKNKICLSFYVTDDNLNLSSIAFENDVYLMYWLAQLIPVYDPDNLLISLQKANTWVEKHLPNVFQSYKILPRWQVINNRFWQAIKKFFERIWGGGYGDLMEVQARGMQLNKMKMNISSVQNEPDTRVVVNDKMLKFHEKDRRLEYKEIWEKRCVGLIPKLVSE